VQKKALPAFLSVMIEQYFTGQWAKAKTAARLELQCNANRRAQATGRRKGGPRRGESELGGSDPLREGRRTGTALQEWPLQSPHSLDREDEA
jgi:hypothetical protein